MALTLALDAATYTASVALIDGERLLGDRVLAMRGEREERLMPAVAELLDAHQVAIPDLAGIVCGAGPGSFTSLRIAASIAKGIALGTGIPLYAVSSLKLIVAGSDATMRQGRWLSSLEAMRGDCFVQLFESDADGFVADAGEPMLVRGAELPSLARQLEGVSIGPGRDLDATPHARGVRRLLRDIRGAQPVSLAEWEPSYGRQTEAQVRWEAAHNRPLTGR